MVNTLLTVSQITRKALMILHQKANFISSINKAYDDSFAKEGAKIGDSLRIRLPNRYVTRNTVALSTQDTKERQIVLAVSKRMGVDVSFTSAELTLSMDDFSNRILDPAMSVLAAGLEADAMSMIEGVPQQVNNQGAPCQWRHVMEGRRLLGAALTPLDKRSANLNLQDNVDLIDNLKGLVNDKSELSKQYIEGYMGRTAGFDFMENTLWPRHTRGTANAAYVVGTAPAQGATTLNVTTGAGTLKKGDSFTIAGVYRVHQETRQPTAYLMQFKATADYAGGAGDIGIYPALYSLSTGASAADQTVSALPAPGAALVIAGTSGATWGQSLMYHKDAFTFATADLVMPNGVDFKAREVLDGISMRIIRAYDINTDAFPCRIDVQYGYKELRTQTAAVLACN
jgi:hypothetical protein